VVMCLVGAVALRVVQPHVHGPNTARRAYAGAVAVMAVGIVGLAFAPDEVTGSSAIILAGGALPLARSFATIWVNGQTASAVRATVHSLFAQADYLGGIVCGLAVAALPGLFPALLTCGLLLFVVSLIALGSGTFRGAEGHR
jgi:cyanate permease